MNTTIDLINAAYLILALFIGIASAIALFTYSKYSWAKAIERVYANSSMNTVHAKISDLRKETRMSIWLIFCTNIGICFLIFKGLH
jgi:hypothetical protein